MSAGSPAVTTASLRQRLVSGGAWAFGGRLFIALTGFASNAMLARLLSPEDLGAYFLAFSMVAVGTGLGSLGLNQAVVRFVAESIGLNQYARARRVVGLVFGLGLLGAVTVGAAYLLFGDALGEGLFHSPALAAVTGLVAGWMVVSVLQGLLAETFRGFHDIRLATVFGGPMMGGGLVTGILLTAGLFFLLLVEARTTLGVVVLLAAGSGCASALLAGWLLRRRVALLPATDGIPDRAELRGVLHVAWPLLVTSLMLSVITQADLWILGAFRPAEDVAIYGAASRLVGWVGMTLFLVNAVVPPLIAEMYAQGRTRELERLLRTTAALAGIPAFLVLAGFIVSGGQILGLVFGDFYRGAATVLAVLSLGKLVQVWAGSCGITLMMTGHQVAVMTITGVCGAVAVVTGLMVVDRYGATGMATAITAGWMLESVALWLAAKLSTGMSTHADLFGLVGLMKKTRKDW